MKVLITGGFGYVGGRCAQFLSAQSGFAVVLGSRRMTEPPDWLPEARVVETKWESPAKLEELCTDVDAIVHTAGMNASDCAFDPVRAVEFNAGITARLLHAAIKRGVKRFIYLSTAHVYGGVLSGNISETTCAVSLHPYATSHRAGEDVVLGARQRGEIEGVAMRLSNAYGAPAHRDVNCWMLLVNDLCRQALTSQRMVLRSTGMQRRDFIALTDACRAIMALLKLPERELGDGLFNAGGEWSPTILEMAHRIAERVFSVTGRKPEIRRQLGGIGKSTEALNYQIQKLIDIGFDLSSNDIVDREIDELIRFCIENMM